MGGAEVIQLIDKELPAPAKGEVQIRQTAIGFNFIDVYQRCLIEVCCGEQSALSQLSISVQE
jgi:NADPH:quinone reductase-like Zn-dependent oxidoreductase